MYQRTCVANRVRCLGAVAFLVWQISLGLLTHAAEATQHKMIDGPDGKQLLVECRSTMTSVTGLVFRAEVDLGDLPEREQVSVRLNVENPYSVDFDVSGSSTSCNCTKLATVGPTIKAEDKTEITWSLTPQDLGTRGNPLKVLTVNLDLKPPPVGTQVTEGLVTEETSEPLIARLQIVCRYRIAAALGFNSPSVYIEVPKHQGTTEIRAPFAITPPLDVTALEVECTGVLSRVDWRIDNSGEWPAVVGAVDEQMTDDLPAAGVLTLRSLQIPKSASLQYLVRSTSASSVAPRMTTLRRSEDDETVRGKVMVRLTDPDRDTDRDEGTIIRCIYEGHPIAVDQSYLGSGVFRVAFAVPKSRLLEVLQNENPLGSRESSMTGRLQWRLDTPEGTHEQSSLFSVSLNSIEGD